MAEVGIERELKLSVWPGYGLPDLGDLIDGGSVSDRQEQHLDAAYYDTPDLRLLRRGVTLRFRRGEPPGDVWTARLPSGTPAVRLDRREITFPGGASSVPAALAELVRGWALGSPLTPVARLRTVRRRVTLNDADGLPQAVVDDDEVSILRGGRVAARFRELEVELLAEVQPGLMPIVAERLQSAGAQPVDQVPKLVRALGPPALAPWEFDQSPLGAHPTAAEVVRAGLLAGAARFVDHVAAMVLDEDPVGVHQARVGTRRLRSDLRSFQTLLDPDSTRSLRDELHRVRILAKRLRYATDVCVPVAGKPARYAARVLAKLQDVLGEHNDARIALDRLRELTDDATPAAAWTSGALGGLQIARAERCRARFPSAYRSAIAKSRWRWLS